MSIVAGALLTGYAGGYPQRVKAKDYVVRTVRDLDMREWESLIDLLLEFQGSTEEYVGDLLPELSMAAVKNGRTEACMFVSSYGGTLWVERLVVRENGAGEVIWQAVKDKVQAYF